MAALTKLTTNINLEMSGDTKSYMVSAKQGDKATRYVNAKLLNNGAEYTIPTDSRVVVNIKKPDGKRVYNTCSYSGSTVTVELTNQALAAAGTAYCDIEIRTSDNSQVITSASFTIEIEEAIRDENALLSANEFSELELTIKKHIENIDSTVVKVEKKLENGDFVGAIGTRGSRWSTGTGITGTSTTATIFTGTGITDALVGDYYLNTSTGNVYQCTVSGVATVAKWIYTGNIKGATGEIGTRGSRWSTGTEITGTSTTATIFTGTGITDALVGDYYLNTSTGNVYQCAVSGVATVAKWIYTGNIKKGNADTATALVATLLTNEDLNSYNTSSKCGNYYAKGSNAVTNKPSNIDSFGLEIISVAETVILQRLTTYTTLHTYIRFYNTSNGWSPWTKLVDNTDLDNSGRNFLRNSSFNDGINFWAFPTGGVIEDEKFMGNGVVTITNTSTTTRASMLQYFLGSRSTFSSTSRGIDDVLISGQTYTLSGWVRLNNNNDTLSAVYSSTVTFRLCPKPLVPTDYIDVVNIVCNKSTLTVGEWTYVSKTFTMPTFETYYSAQVMVSCGCNSSGLPISISASMLKLEKGNIATGYIPAIEDAYNSNLLIGGRNILKDGALKSLYSNNVVTLPIISELITESGYSFYRIKNAGTGSNTNSISVYNTIPFTQITESLAGKTVTFSHKVRPSKDCIIASSQVGLYGTSSTKLGSDAMKISLKGGIWQTISQTVTFPNDLSVYSGVRFAAGPFNGFENEYVDYREWKIEFGNIATDWTPAPEDAVDKANQLTTARNINGVPFNGLNDISINKLIPKTLPSTSNLNDYLAVDEYSIYYVFSGNSVTNKPSGVDAFSLEVIKTNGTTGTCQRICAINTESMWIRFYNTSWSSWRKVVNEDVLNSAISNLNSNLRNEFNTLVAGKATVEKGTFSPNLYDGENQVTGNIVYRTGYYRVIGDLVYIYVGIVVTGGSVIPVSSNLTIRNLPFVPITSVPDTIPLNFKCVEGLSSGASAHVRSGSSYIYIIGSSTGTYGNINVSGVYLKA